LKNPPFLNRIEKTTNQHLLLKSAEFFNRILTLHWLFCSTGFFSY
jgi:hypothetical protein